MNNWRKATFCRVMNGYEFIDFMRKFGWKKKGFQKQTLTNDHYGYLCLSEIRKKFEGWEYWFDTPCCDKLLNEDREISISMLRRNYGFENVKKILIENGFRET